MFLKDLIFVEWEKNIFYRFCLYITLDDALTDFDYFYYMKTNCL